MRAIIGHVWENASRSNSCPRPRQLDWHRYLSMSMDSTLIVVMLHLSRRQLEAWRRIE